MGIYTVRAHNLEADRMSRTGPGKLEPSNLDLGVPGFRWYFVRVHFYRYAAMW